MNLNPFLFKIKLAKTYFSDGSYLSYETTRLVWGKNYENALAKLKAKFEENTKTFKIEVCNLENLTIY